MASAGMVPGASHVFASEGNDDTCSMRILGKEGFRNFPRHECAKRGWFAFYQRLRVTCTLLKLETSCPGRSFMIGKMKIPCPECGSKNTEIKESKSLWSSIKKYFPIETLRPVSLEGQKVIYCKDCGQSFLFCIR